VTQPTGFPSVYVFDIWGSRGSRSLEPGRSRIGCRTSCYSLLGAGELIVFDAGRGLAALALAMKQQVRFRAISRVHILLSHAHMDHWEGLKDADWFWLKDRPLEVTLNGPAEAIEAAGAAFAHPSYVPLEQLTSGSQVQFRAVPMKVGDERKFGPFRVKTAPLHHYSGGGISKKLLDTAGFRLEVEGGPVVAYLSDHEPCEESAASEAALMDGASLILIDAHYLNVADQAHGHGSLEYASLLAQKRPDTLILAGHCGSLLSDDEIISAVLRHSARAENCRIAREGDSYRWNPWEGRFTSVGIQIARAVAGLPPTPLPAPVPRTEVSAETLRHELRTSALQIVGFCELLEREMAEASSTEYVDDIARMRQSARRILRLLEDVGSGRSPQPAPEGAQDDDAITAAEGAHEEPPGSIRETSTPGDPHGDVLVVDENETSAGLLARRLGREGYRVTVAGNGQQALDRIEEGIWDVVLLQAAMSGLSGLELLRIIRRDRTPIELPVILLLPSGRAQDTKEAIECGANDYFVSTLDFSILLARLRTALLLKTSAARIRRLVEDLPELPF